MKLRNYHHKFAFQGANACPECNIPLRRNNYRVQLFDPMVEKELDIRKRILRDFNKKEEDFANLESFNEYLEDIENIIYNLCNNIDVLETNKKIEQYKKENRDVILKNKQRMGREEMELELILEQEREAEQQREDELKNVEKESKKKKTQEREKLIDELMFSTESAHSILETFAHKKEIETQKEEAIKAAAPPPKKIATSSKFSSGVSFSSSINSQFLPIPITEEGEPYQYIEPNSDYDGPPAPSGDELKRFLKNVRAEEMVERAGGFSSRYSCMRALQEAMQSLYS